MGSLIYMYVDITAQCSLHSFSFQMAQLQLEKHNKETSNKCLCHNAYASLQSINLKFARENGSLNQLA